MSYPLVMLIGGAAFLAAQHFIGTSATIALGALLFAAELIRDLGLYQKRDQREAYRRWRRWHG